jgi:hypothetical protein
MFWVQNPLWDVYSARLSNETVQTDDLCNNMAGAVHTFKKKKTKVKSHKC